MSRNSFAIASCFVLTLMLAAAPAGERPMPNPAFTAKQASAFAKLALKGLNREYPNKPDHVLGGPKDLKSPRALHPAFFGCYDWHSAVHSHWMLVRLLRRFPDLPEAREMRMALGERLTAANIKIEAEYFQRPESKSFERPYGWAWLLKLAEELQTWDDAEAKQWGKNLDPLARLIAAR
ncbi:MAG TPA: DUF2891 family protein, partial [Urbifossiella sp.]